MSNKIELKPISELLGMNFFIPGYQRGYRWTRQQVKDLLDDIQEFIEKKEDGFYSIQPLVVKKNIVKKDEFKYELKIIGDKEENNLIEATEEVLSKYTRWEVIDGQQRLTTIYIILSVLGIEKKEIYTIEYETREKSKVFLTDIKESEAEDNIDFYHIVEAKKEIQEVWFKGKDNDFKHAFKKAILANVKFIWYESVEEDPIKVFTRLNIGKIALTNAELIKALFLNKSNFKGADYHKIRLQQQEIAGEWDKIENTLQSDEFWLFLNQPGYDKPTRIDMIFDLICEKNLFNIEIADNQIGNDAYRTFRYFYFWFKPKENKVDFNIIERWKKIKAFFQTFNEWYNDLELYHYVGFLIENQTELHDLVEYWVKPEQTKRGFVDNYLKPEIKLKIEKCKDLNKQYEINGNSKTQCRPILLLHNIQSVIEQNKNLLKEEKYKLPIFYKFPFHLLKKENWDVEHIDSHAENPLEDEASQKEWLRYTYDFLDEKIMFDEECNLKDEIRKFVLGAEIKKEFSLLWEKIQSTMQSSSIKLEDGKIADGKEINEKDMLWNFTLLDASTNRSYGNSIFSVKRRIIIGKDQGKKIEVDDEFKYIEKEGAIAFIPPSTKNVFMKYYNPTTNNLREWDKQDAVAYLKNIQEMLKDFIN